MSELLANALPHVAAQEGNENWDEEEPYESGILCPSEDSKPTTTAQTSVNRLAQKPDKLPVHMESRGMKSNSGNQTVQPISFRELTKMNQTIAS